MNDLTPIRLNSAVDDPSYTPGGFQKRDMIFRRRLLMAALILSTIAAMLTCLAIVLGSNGWTLLEVGIFTTFILASPWTVMGFWNAVIGFWLLHFTKDPLSHVSPFVKAPQTAGPLSHRTAILMTLRNEDPARAFRRLRIIRASLDRTGQENRFDFFILSDSSEPAIAKAEESLFADWLAEFSDQSRTVYRRREKNDGYKAGNVRDFLERWGGAYDYMLPLDADSLMSGDEIVKMARVMENNPRIGILQSLVTGAPSNSAFARVFQFGMRHGMRSYTMGNAWWNADCGPFWGHNAIARVAPFLQACELPVLPGKPPLGGWILSHDQIEATLMRAAGYEVRVLPVEGESWEENPPSLIDFTKRDLRWCQGNMQYWRLLGLPGLEPLSRFQIGMGIFMYIGALAWVGMISLSAFKIFEQDLGTSQIALGMGLFAFSFFMSIAPKLAGMLDVAMTPGGLARYGGGFRFVAGVVTEILFSMLLAPIAAVRLTIFMISLLFGRSVMWNGQQRDAHRLSWTTAFAGLWPQTLFGLTLTALFAWKLPEVLLWGAPVLIGLTLSIPFAVFTASPAVGRFFTRIGLCAIPEELDMPRDLRALAEPESHKDDDGLPANASSTGQLTAAA